MHDRVLSLRKLTLAASIALATLAAPAHAFSDDEARRAILDLRQQLQQQNEQNSRARLQLADQIQSLQQEIAQLRDQLELVSRQQPSGQGQGQQHPANPQGVEVGDPQEQAAFDGATDLYRKGQYKEAAESLAAFTALYPNSDLAPTAQFYLGSARYASRDYKGAIEQLSNLLQKSPDNARAPDALLVIAGSQIELNNRAGAKTTLQRIVRDYPNSPAANTAKSRLQLL
ncbi:tol-pal system protein YbgF [Bordetella avium]|uniref:Cell division coordinator CpoB n=1 Tax=Bordetella avium (strain 197N) TaxID=360910 RepID=Q2KV87_BORA1|nr:tol-pal system protein YbgF [Bordetella avium]AZY53669.1 tol-pal system protein YbgF [Bordetella avium]RIQ15557.1 tol-pal system protein YbgF [Bordetella avium]RIQ19639.1 tol-pal system protein YbgF [Bordetella avium]RIQ34218.1 tol-pal system protein YbgF [Bordetella avium]RIQ38334.1 tol-pal system protein YbgF [Bordetella avium]